MRKDITAVIVIPLFQTTLQDFEQKSLDQCFKIFSAWPVCFVSPEGLDLSEIVLRIPKPVDVAYFPKDYFRSVSGYNRLMTFTGFYKKFEAYDFMLIYQLDAFVFEDRLGEWCRKGYDYIGAPAFHAEGFDSLKFGESEDYARELDSRRLVFNGGYSLRRIRAMIRFLHLHNTVYPKWKGNEDMLFSLSSTRLRPLKPFIKLPHWKEALCFAFERSPAASYKIIGETLPFGCHAWQRYDPGFWEEFME